MKVIPFRIFTAIALLGVVLFSCKEAPKTEATAKKPNVVFIFADDHSYNALSNLGADEVYTPNLDRLRKNGTDFSHTYNMGGWNGAICVASRAMINTGQYIWNARRTDSLVRKGQPTNPYWSEYMQQAGYDTYMTGKWHVSRKAEELFNTVGHVRGGMPRSVKTAYNRPLSVNDTVWKSTDTINGGFWAGGTHWSEVVANDALQFIDSAKTKENPFFMYLAFNAPHDPRQAPQEYLDKYPLKNVAVPETFLEEYPYHEEMGAGKKLRDERLAPYPRTPYSIQVHRKEYYALISHMDTQIGKILDALEATGEMDNTYIVFTADHGLSVGQHGLLGKQNMYDHSVRVPFYVVGPDVPKGKTIDAPIYLQDVMPTTLEWAQQAIPEHVEFSSLVPLIQGKGKAHLPYIYGAYTENQRMVRTDNHKLIWYPKAEKIRLFDLKKDPLEQNDVADDANYAEVKTDLIEKLQSLQQDMHDPIPSIGK